MTVGVSVTIGVSVGLGAVIIVINDSTPFIKMCIRDRMYIDGSSRRYIRIPCCR